MNEIATQPQLPTARERLPISDPPVRAAKPQNVGQGERLVSMVGGAALVFAGLARGRGSGLLLTACGGALLYRGWTGHCHGYDALGIDTAEHNRATSVPAGQGIKIEKTIAINRPREEIYQLWRKLENLPKLMQHLETVQQRDGNQSHWAAAAPFGQSIEWDAEVFQEREPELIAWRSLPGGDVETAGSVRFVPLGHDRGTAMTISLKYNPPGGKVAASLASLFGSGLEQRLDADLRRFKSTMEAGEAPTTAGQPRGI